MLKLRLVERDLLSGGEDVSVIVERDNKLSDDKLFVEELEIEFEEDGDEIRVIVWYGDMYKDLRFEMSRGYKENGIEEV